MSARRNVVLVLLVGGLALAALAVWLGYPKAAATILVVDPVTPP